MATRKSQTELERPAKVYEVMALESQIKSLNEQLQRMNNNMETLLLKSETQITPQQLAENLAAVRISFDKEIKDTEERIHLEYGPIKKANSRLLWLVAAAAVSLVGQFIFVGYITG